jgi:predicted nucleic acid-binding protein
VVINSAYPLYELRRGDLWYQLETALREVCVTIPEATVPEFERKVNELMLVSLALAERRRRGTKRQPAERKRRGALWK